MRRRSAVLALSLLLAIGPAPAVDAPGTKPLSHAALRRSLPHVLTENHIRVFYATEGEHAVAADDLNQNAIPDQAEDVMIQTLAAWRLWTSLGFADPLTTPRYQGSRWLDIHLLSRGTLGSNGVAYDEIQRFGRDGDPAGTGSLCFDVATSVKAPANLTPAHELFHILQNSVCFLKNRWFTEGTARWSEAALGRGGLPAGLQTRAWPPAGDGDGDGDGDALQAVFDGAYDTAGSYWAPLLALEDPDGRLPADRLTRDLREARYINGEPVLKDLHLTGWQFIRELLQALDAADDRLQLERGLGRWPEAEQFSPANNAVIHRVVTEVVARRRSSRR
jgi:hypothetical protein